MHTRSRLRRSSKGQSHSRYQSSLPSHHARARSRPTLSQSQSSLSTIKSFSPLPQANYRSLLRRGVQNRTLQQRNKQRPPFRTFFSRLSAPSSPPSSQPPTMATADDDLRLIKFSDQVVQLPSHEDLLAHLSQLRLAQEDDYIVKEIATYLPPSNEHAPFFLPHESPSSFVDYINHPTASLGTSLVARNYHAAVAKEAEAEKKKQQTSNNNSTSQSTISDAVPLSPSTSLPLQSPLPPPSALSESDSDSDSESESTQKADVDLFNLHFAFFRNLKSSVIPQLTPYTLGFTHKGKYTFNYPPNTTKLSVKYIPQEYLPNHPQLFTNYPSFRNTWIHYPYITVPQVTIGEYFGQSTALSASGAEAALDPFRNQAVRMTSVEELLKREKKSFVPIEGVISKEELDSNCQLLSQSLNTAQLSKRSTKHAYTHESEQILFPRSQTRQFGFGKMNQPHQPLTFDATLQTKVLPSGQTPDLFPSFPSLPFLPTSRHLPQPKSASPGSTQAIPPLSGAEAELDPILASKSTSYFDTLHSTSAPQDATATPPQSNPDTPYIDPFHSIIKPFRPYDPQRPGETILPSEPERAATALMTTSTQHKQYTLQQYRLELLPKLFKSQPYSPVLSDSTIQQLIRTPVTSTQLLRINKDDILSMYSAQLTDEYQNTFSPLSPHFNSNKPRQQHYLVPSDLLNATILNHITSNAFQLQYFLPQQLIDFIGPPECDDYVKHFEHRWETVGTKSNALLRYALAFHLFNVHHPYKYNASSSLFQQLRTYSYQHFNPLFYDIFQGNEAHLQQKQPQSRPNPTLPTVQSPTAKAVSEFIELELHLFSNTTVLHDPYLQSGWYHNLEAKLHHTEAFLQQFNDIPVSTLQLVSSLFPPSAAAAAAAVPHPITPPRSPTQLQQRQSPKQLLSITDFMRDKKHHAIIHGALVNPASKMLYTTFSAVLGAPYDPHFLGYDGFTSQLALYEILRTGNGYTGAQWLASDEIQDTTVPINVPYKENFWEPTPM